MRDRPDFPAARQPDFALALRRGVLSGDVAQMGTGRRSHPRPQT